MKQYSQDDVFLKARDQIALARVMGAHFHRLAARESLDAVLEVYEQVAAAPAPLPWMPRTIADEPALVFAYRLGEAIQAGRQKYLLACAQLEIEAQQRKVRKYEKRIEQIARNYAEYPSAQELLERLRNGELVALNGHNLFWERCVAPGEPPDEENGILDGDNPYGAPYFWSDRLNVNTVASWRHAMVMGRTLGECPLETADNEEDYIEPSEQGFIKDEGHDFGVNVLLDARVLLGKSTTLIIAKKWRVHPLMHKLLEEKDWGMVNLFDQDEATETNGRA